MQYFNKIVLSTLFLLLAGGQSQAQDYADMMNDPSFTLREVINAAESYFENKPKGKGTGYANYQRWRYEMEFIYELDQDRREYSLWEAHDAYETFIKKYPYQPQGGTQKTRAQWVDLGPYDAENISRHYSPGIGRVEDIYRDKNNPNLLYLSSRSGGVWSSTDGGVNWSTGTDFLPSSGCNTFGVDPIDPDIIYANIKNPLNNHTQGIYKSTDGGDNWVETTYNRSTQGLNRFVHKIRHHPTRTGYVFAGTSNQGLIRSTNGMNNWSSVLSRGNIYEIIFHPTNPDTMYVYNRNENGLHRSFNAGATWTFLPLNDNNGARGYIDVSDAAPDYVWFISSAGVWKSRDLGENWINTGTITNNILEVSVSNVDTNLIMWGNIDMFRSTDGGQTMEQIADWYMGGQQSYPSDYVHADLRQISTQGGDFLIGTDGYFCVSSDEGDSWTRLNINGTGIRENYTMGLAQSHHLYDIIGSQDNGTSIRNNGTWIEWLGADGMEGIIHPLNENLMIGSQQNAGRHKTTDGGYDQQWVNGIPSGNWIAPMSYDPNNQMHVYDARERIYKSESFGGNWEEIGNPAFGRTVQFMEVAYNNSDIIYASAGSSIKKSTNGGETWNSITSGLPSLNIRGIAVDPFNDNYVVVVYDTWQSSQAKVYVSTNGGSTWSNATYNMTIPVRSVEIGPDGNIYIGCEIGVYYKSINGTQWNTYNPGLPTMAVRDLEIHWGTNTIRAATWGRGMWEFDLVGRGHFPKIKTVDISEEMGENSPNEQHDVFIQAEIDDVQSFQGMSSVSSAEVHYSVNTDEMDLVITMTLTNGTAYESSMPIPSDSVSAGDIVLFKIVVTDNEGNTTESHKFTYDVFAAEYCQAEGANGTTADYINLVELEDIINPSGQTNYSDFTNLETVLNRGEEYTLSFSLDFAFDLDKPHAWIDWDNDFIFEDSEKINLVDYNSSHETTGSFTVPMTAELGALRLRVRNIYDGSEEACGSYFGEVEDYTVIIESALLPVTFISIAGERLNQQNRISWRTADEINLSHYEIERRSLEESEWTILSQKTFPNQLSANSYTVIDDSHALYETYLYRVVSIDLDGTKQYSNIVSISASSVHGVVAYPNPATTDLLINLDTESSGFNKLYSDYGQLMKEGLFTAEKQLGLSLLDLQAGKYLVIVETEKGTTSIPVIKL